MNIKIALFLVLFSFLGLNAQLTKSFNIHILSDENVINPEFKGGLTAFFEYVSNNLAYGHVTENVSELITVQFTIDSNGNLINFKTIQDSEKSIFKFGKQIGKVLKKSPKWIPGKIKGVTSDVNLQMQVPVNINIIYYEDEY